MQHSYSWIHYHFVICNAYHMMCQCLGINNNSFALPFNVILSFVNLNPIWIAILFVICTKTYIFDANNVDPIDRLLLALSSFATTTVYCISCFFSLVPLFLHLPPSIYCNSIPLPKPNALPAILLILINNQLLIQNDLLPMRFL